MSKAGGVLLAAVGLGLVAYAAIPQGKPPVSGSDDFDITLTQAMPGKTEPTSKTAPATAAPATPVRPRAPEARPESPAASAPAVVSLPNNRASVRLPVTAQPKLGMLATDRSQLARELQRELRRVGCYEGEINGGWTTSTKRAMKTFTERVNASLPIEEPDVVLLSLIQGQPDKVCAQPCPAGESAEGGRCVPTAVAARKPVASAPAHDAAPAIGGWSATAPAASSAPLDGRMALSGPEDDEATAIAGAAAPSPPLHQRPANYTAPAGEGRGERGPTRRFDAGSFFRGLDKQSAN